MATEDQYPEHVKLKAIQEKSQEIGDFLDWLSFEKKVTLCKEHTHNDGCFEEGKRVCGLRPDDLWPIMTPHTNLLAQYFGIDQDKLESEKKAMLATLRR